MADDDDDYFSSPSYKISLPTIPAGLSGGPQQPETRYDGGGTGHGPNYHLPNDGQATRDKPSVMLDTAAAAGAQRELYFSCRVATNFRVNPFARRRRVFVVSYDTCMYGPFLCESLIIACRIISTAVHACLH